MKSIKLTSATISRTDHKAFTLIELLVVIAIIAILMGLLFPAVQGAMDQARKASAKNDVVQIANAVTMYETEYGKLPPDSSSVNGNLLKALMATDTNFNSRKIVFLEAPDFKRNKGGVSNDAYLDPRGGEYKIKMDTDYENSISVGSANGPTTVTVRKRVGVWNENSNKRLRVGSWE
ncbi:MAG: type II secretion system protein [Chthoniobacterales bacterium]